MRKRNWQRIVWLPFTHPLRFKKDPFTFSINVWHSTISISNRYIIWCDLETLILDKNWSLNTYWKMHVACFNLSTNHWTCYIVRYVHIYISNINHRGLHYFLCNNISRKKLIYLQHLFELFLKVFIPHRYGIKLIQYYSSEIIQSLF